MNIVNIEARTFERMMAKFEIFAGKVGQLFDTYADKGEKKWLTGPEVCEMLGISPRTLQTYRDNGTLPYARIRHKIYFKPADIDKIINKKR